MSIHNEIDRIITAVQAAHEKVAEKGGTTAQPYLVANLASAIDSIPDASDPVLQEKTVTPKTSAQSVTPDSGYDGLSKVTVNAMPTATQATPSISVNSSGLITASATQSAGYVSAGTKSATKQLTTQAAKTITPSTSSQTAVAKGVYTTGAVTVAAIPSTYVKPTTTKTATTYTPNTADQTIAAGTYCSGAQTIKGDANLVAGNIKSGVSIFGVAGSYEGSGSSGGGGSVETCTVQFEYTDFVSDLPGALYYTKPDLTFGSAIYQASREGPVPPISVTVLKNSIVALAGSVTEEDKLGFAESFACRYQGDCEPLIESFIGGCALYVTGDCIISGSNG